jgi:cell wall-associated NlpC family hydrolase
VSASEDETAARLLERLLSDTDYRAAFRADPVAASHAAGLDGVARELAADRGKAMQTLDGRESRSSLAGVLLAAALEGSAIVDFSQQVLPHLDEVPRAVGDVLAGLSPLGVEDAQAATPQRAAVEPVAGEFRAITPDEAVAAKAPSAAELLHDRHVSFDADGIADLRAGRVDPRLVSVLGAVSRQHTISISVIASGHDKYTSGGSVSNHYYGRALDVSVVDGSPVSPGNSAARELAVALSRLPPSIRPTEIGSPWALPGAAYFTDGAHQNHVHIGFDDPVPAGWRPPAGIAPAGNGAAVEMPAVGAPAAEIPAVEDDEEAAEPGGLEDPGGDTDAEADAESDGDGGGDEDNDSVSDDASDERENDEESDESDGGVDGDHDDSSDSGSDDTSDSDSSDGGEDSGDDDEDGEDDDAGGGDVDAGSGDASGDGAPIDLGDAGGSYPGDDASQAELATWMGAAAQRRGLPAELPVMAALVESHLTNLGYGDADSVGFFQMRLGTWNNGDYAGYPDRPELQLKWFLDQAEAVKRQRVAAGKPLGATSYGDWIADIERPAAQYRGRYQPQLAEAHELLRRSAHVGGGQDGGARLEEVVDGGGPGGGPRALAAVHEARRYLGTPYQWGGSTPQTGFDCSGLMQWAYAKAGIRIPRTTYDQIDAANARPVGRRELQPGDLVFFRDSSGDVHHVGMSLGGDRFIQAPHTGDVVKISSLKEPYYAEQFTGGRRFDLSGRAQAVAAAVGSGDGDAAALPGVDPAAAHDAEAALLRDAAEAQHPGTLLFEAVRAQELPKLRGSSRSL